MKLAPLARYGRWVLWMLPPFLAATWVAGTTIPGSVLDPWRPNMLDLEVYARTGRDILAGNDFYATASDQLPWIYPPFAALLTIPLAVMGVPGNQYAWLALNVVALFAILHRVGVRGWWLSLLTAASVTLVEPVRETLAFGQLGIVLVGAAVLDTMPGRRILGPRRWLPAGWLVGVAAAVKLTPAAVAAYNFFAGRRREGLVAFATFCAATGIAFALLPGASLKYWGGLLSGNSGINEGILFKTNQSVMGVYARLFGELSRGGLVVSALVALLGLASAVLVDRAGERELAVCLAGLTSLLASPISWSHHYVWVVPLAVLLVRHQRLTWPLRVVGLFHCLWIATAPFKPLPGGDGAELRYTPVQQIVADAGVLAGVLLLVMALSWALFGLRRGGTPVDGRVARLV